MAKRQYGKWLVILWLIAATTAHATDYGDLRVTIENLSPGTHEHGYIEYRATITNRSQQQRHRVTLLMPGTPGLLIGETGDVLRALTRSVEVAPQATVVVSILKPPVVVESSNVAVAIDGVWQNNLVPSPASGFQREMYRGSRYYGRLLTSAGIKKLGVMAQAEASLPSDAFEAESLEIPLNEWSRNWLGYSSYDGILLTSAEWRDAPEAIQEALIRYVECGGTMSLFGKGELALSWQKEKSVKSWRDPPDYLPSTVNEQAASNAEAPESQLSPLPTPPKVTANLEQHFVGLGVVMTTEQMALTTAQWQTASAHWQISQRGMNGGGVWYGNYSDLVGNIETPVRGLFILMLSFVIAIGPLNLWLLSRKRKRLWLLWTVPAISILTCLAVFGYAVFSEGFRGYEGIRCLTILDETSHRAASLAYAGYYSPLTPSAGLHFGIQTELTHNQPYNYRRQKGVSGSLDWSNDQHFANGWVAARVPSYFTIRKSETRRERLTITAQADGSIQIVNGLGAPITQLWFANARGVLHEASSTIPAGASAQLKVTEKMLEAQPPKMLRDPLPDYRSENVFFMEDDPRGFLRAGHYLAVLDGAPFIEQGLANIRERRARTLVYGIPSAAASTLR